MRVVLEQRGQARVAGDGDEHQPDAAGGMLEPGAPGHLVEARQDEARRAEQDHRAGRCLAARYPAPDQDQEHGRAAEEEHAEHAARFPHGSAHRREPEREPDAREHGEAGADERIARQEGQDAGDELQRHRNPSRT